METLMDNTDITEAEHRALERFVFLEAQLADESRWEEWEALLADDMHYWVPINAQEDQDGLDPSIINDNRSRLATRLRQLRTGARHSQAPKSVMRRMVSNMVMERLPGDLYKIEANMVIYEYQNQSTMKLNVWPGRVEYRLRKNGKSFLMVLKKVHLVHASGPVPTLSFLV